ncbi:MAG: enoyl-CoA hydratase/isomerase family protein [Syntrophomonas sp.]
MNYETLVLEKQQQIAILTMNLPESLNAMDFQMAEDFKHAISDVKRDPEIKVLLLTGQGSSFCSGGSLETIVQIYNAPPAQGQINGLSFYECFLSIKELSIPTIAILKGYVIGAGLCLAMACDMRIASTDSKLAMSFVKLALNPGMGGTYSLPRLVGVTKALELCLTGDTIDAGEALRIGLVNHIVSTEELMEFSLGIGRRIASNPAVAVRLIKELIYKNQNLDLASCLMNESLVQAICASTDDMKEGISAIKEKRRPQFKGH